MTTPAVTVLTAARNAQRFLPETIRSIQAQTFEDWEYVVVDDASDDDTIAIVQEAARTDPRVHLVRRSAPGGPYAAANDGLATAKGKYIVRIDADDLALPNRVSRQLAFLAENPRLRGCAASVLKLDGEALTQPRSEGLPIRPGSLKWRFCVRGGLTHSTLCVEREALDEIGGYRPLPTSQDFRVWCNLARRRWLGIVDEVLVYWRVHASQLTQEKAELQSRHSLDVQRDHVNALVSEEWRDDDLLRLRWIGRRRQPVVDGLRTIARFERMWTKDMSLESLERRELATFTSRLRADHLRVALRSRLETVPGAERIMRARSRLRQRPA